MVVEGENSTEFIMIRWYIIYCPDILICFVQIKTKQNITTLGEKLYIVSGGNWILFIHNLRRYFYRNASKPRNRCNNTSTGLSEHVNIITDIMRNTRWWFESKYGVWDGWGGKGVIVKKRLNLGLYSVYSVEGSLRPGCMIMHIIPCLLTFTSQNFTSHCNTSIIWYREDFYVVCLNCRIE